MSPSGAPRCRRDRDLGAAAARAALALAARGLCARAVLRQKCGYCDFASLAGFDHLADRYLSALEREISSALETPQRVETIFVGGGTPTRLDVEQLERLTTIIRTWLLLGADGEWTVEANPGTLDAEKCAVLADAGVNRISLGAQSFRPELLAVLERHHGRAEVERAVELVATRFPRWSLDLIFGVPGSTLGDWESDIETALGSGLLTFRVTASSMRRELRSGISAGAARFVRLARTSSSKCSS